MALSPTQQVQAHLASAQHILIATKEAYGIDGLASCIALAEALEKLGKEVVVATHGFRIIDEHKILPKVERIHDVIDKRRQIVITLAIPKEEIAELRYNADVDKLNIIITPKTPEAQVGAIETKELSGTFDLIFCIDTPDLGSLGHLFEDNTDLFYHTPIINIDHTSQNEQFGEVNIVDTTAVASSEVVFRLLQALSQGREDVMDQDSATCLLAGMISKTHCFKSSNVTPRALSIASELVTRGARREEIVCQLYQNRSVETLQFWGTVLSRLRADRSGRIVWSTITAKDTTSPNDEQRLTGVIDELIANMPQVEVVVLFIADESHTIVAHVTALGRHDALALVRDLHPEGNKAHAHATLGAGELKPSIEKVIMTIQSALGIVSSPTPPTPSP
ncbi:MAG: DHH family phosphoesterase [bacterium]|nr:DHH family phosphoesterase [bacterium]